MITSPFTYAAELEQAATVSAFEDQCIGEPQAPTAARFGYAGIELMWEYENAIFEMEREGLPADFVIFH